MKKYPYLLILVLLACFILFLITRPLQRTVINNDFVRLYSVIEAKRDTIISLPHKIDLLAAWKGNIIYYGLAAKLLGECSITGNIVHEVPFVPVSNVSSIFSISTTPQNIYCFDINSRCVFITDFLHPLQFKDSLPKETRGAIVNNSGGYTLLRYQMDSARMLIQDTIEGKSELPIYTMNKMYDNGLSHWGQCLRSEDGSYFINLPFYHSQILVYNYSRKQISLIRTLDKTPVKDITIPVGKGRIISSRSPIINRRAAASKQWLFILSYARGKDDTDQAEIIDIYDLSTGRYKSSLLLPGLIKGSIVAMTVVADKLLLSRKNEILIYSLHENNVS